MSGEPFTLLDMVVRNKAGVAARISDLIASRGLSIANITTPGIITSDIKEGRLFILVEKCDEACGSSLEESLKKELGDIVLSVKHLSALNAYVFPKSRVLMLADMRAHIFTHGLLREGFREMYKQLASTPGLEAHFHSLLRSFGRGIGRHLYERWNVRIEDVGGFEEYVERGLRFFEAIYSALGLGVVKASIENYVNYLIEIIDNWECLALSEAGLAVNPQVTLGIIEGYFNSMLGRRVAVSTTRTGKAPGETSVFTVESLGSLA